MYTKSDDEDLIYFI